MFYCGIWKNEALSWGVDDRRGMGGVGGGMDEYGRVG